MECIPQILYSTINQSRSAFPCTFVDPDPNIVITVRFRLVLVNTVYLNLTHFQYYQSLPQKKLLHL